MRVWASGIAALLQVLVLAFMAGQREYVAVHGTRVWLPTVPVDPRDMFRGDYVRLRYEASSVPKERWGGTLSDARHRRRGERVYAVLGERGDGLWEVQTLTDVRPEGGLYLRARVESSDARGIAVRYGLEAYFMQQGTAADLESQRNRDGVLIPLEMEVAVGRSGIAVLRGYRSGRLGIGVDFDIAPEGRLRTGKLKVRLVNTWDKPLAVVDSPEHGSFAMVPAQQWQPPKPWRWARAGAPVPAPTDADVHVLAPGEAYAFVLDINQPPWFVQQEGDPQPRALLGVDDWSATFRLAYRPPAATECAGLQQAALVWHGELHSSSFNGRNRVD